MMPSSILASSRSRRSICQATRRTTWGTRLAVSLPVAVQERKTNEADNVFVGDSLFHVDIGTARCDFPGGSAHALYQSAKKLLSLPDEVRIWTGHDYPPEGEREPVPSVSVKEHREKNRHMRDGVSEDQFVAMRSERDAHLAAPRLLHESLQVNVRGGRLPKENEAGMRLLKLPLKMKGGASSLASDQ